MPHVEVIPDVDIDGKVISITIALQGILPNATVGVFYDEEQIDKVVTDDNGDAEKTTLATLSSKHKIDLEGFGYLSVKTSSVEIKSRGTSKILAETSDGDVFTDRDGVETPKDEHWFSLRYV